MKEVQTTQYMCKVIGSFYGGLGSWQSCHILFHGPYFGPYVFIDLHKLGPLISYQTGALRGIRNIIFGSKNIFTSKHCVLWPSSYVLRTFEHITSTLPHSETRHHQADVDQHGNIYSCHAKLHTMNGKQAYPYYIFFR